MWVLRLALVFASEVFLYVTASDPTCSGGLPASALVQQRQQVDRFIDVHSVQQRQQVDRFIDVPKALTYEDLQQMQIDTSDMHESHSDGVIIMAYSAMEDKFVSGAVVRGGAWEPGPVHHAFALWNQSGQVGNFMDVGANIGTWTLPLSRLIKDTSKKIISIEASPRIGKHIMAGIKRNAASNVILYNYAMGAPVADDDVTFVEHWDNKGGSGLADRLVWSEDQRAVKYSVPLTTLDSILHGNSDLENVFFMKVDIEGSEKRMLHGAQKFFSQHPPCFLHVELSDPQTQAEFEAYGYEHIGSAGFDHDFRQKDMKACIASKK